MKNRTTAGAFTLIELLVVVVIIGILASLLLVVIGMVRDSARGLNCLSNQRQIGIALLTYTSDNRQMIPPIQIQGDAQRASYNWDIHGPDGRNENFGGAWTVFIAPYIENFSATGVFLCPAWTKRSAYDPTGSNPLATLYAGSYGMNSWLWIQMLIDGRIKADGTGTYGNIRMGQVDNPTGQIWLAEHWGINTSGENVQQCATDAPWNARPMSGPRRASDYAGAEAALRLSHAAYKKANYLYMDGHVGMKTIEQTGGTSQNTTPNEWTGKP